MDRSEWEESVADEYTWYSFGRFSIVYLDNVLIEVDELIMGDWKDVTDNHCPKFDYSKPKEWYC